MVLNKRKYVEKGVFRLPFGIGMLFAIFSIVYELWTMVVYCLPPSYPVNAENANFTPVFLGFGTIISLLCYYFYGRHRFTIENGHL